ncbi:MAG: cation-translocating P-type ATPase [Clostridia bacterium]|nr:cation-translocating P-type ATPase [Clostridia bacterium]
MSDKKANKNIYLFVDRNLIRNSALFLLVSAACLFLASVTFAGNKTVELVLYAIAIAVSGHEIAIKAFEKLITRKLTVELVITVAVLTIFAISHFQEAVLVTLLYSLGNLITLLIRSACFKKYCENNNAAITVKVVDEQGNVTVKSVTDLKAGESALVKAGETFLFDGTVEDKKFSAGDVNDTETDIIAKVTTAYDCELDFELLYEDDKSASFMQRAVLSILSYFTPIAVAAAFLTFSIPFAMGLPFKIWLYRAAIVLVIANPVAVKSLIQTHIILTLSNLKSKGVSVSNSKQLELISKIKHLVINKAGVVTKGEYTVADIFTADGYTSEQVLAVANMAQSGIDNSVAKAIKAAAGDNNVGVDAQIINNKGVVFEYNGKFVVCGSAKLMEEKGIDVSAFPQVSLYVAIDSVVIGAIKLNDTLKSDSVKAIKLLKTNGIDCTLVTADNENIANIISEKCGFAHSHSLATDDKKEKIIKTVSKNKFCGFIGSDKDDISCFEAANVAMSMPQKQGVENSIDNQKLTSVNYAITAAKSLFSLTLILSIISVLCFAGLIALAILGKIDMWIAIIAEVIINCGWMYLVYATSGNNPDATDK